MWYVIGLGNKGEQYKNTRHNIAWVIFEEWDLEWQFEKMLPGEYTQEGECTFVKPHTYMNRSGEVIRFLRKRDPEFTSDHTIVIYDDLDLPFGSIKISYDRGDGGHNGVKSIVAHLGTKACIRIRIGIAQVREEKVIKPNVLSPFLHNELSLVQAVLAPQVHTIVKSLISEGLEKTMNTFNKK